MCNPGASSCNTRVAPTSSFAHLSLTRTGAYAGRTFRHAPCTHETRQEPVRQSTPIRSAGRPSHLRRPPAHEHGAMGTNDGHLRELLLQPACAGGQPSRAADPFRDLLPHSLVRVLSIPWRSLRQNIVELPQRVVDLLVHFLEQGDGKLSKRARMKEFGPLTAHFYAASPPPPPPPPPPPLTPPPSHPHTSRTGTPPRPPPRKPPSSSRTRRTRPPASGASTLAGGSS